MVRGPLLLLLVALASLGTAVGPAPAGGFTPHLAIAHDLALPGELGASTVSSGAEPIIHVTRDGSTILVADVTGMYRSTNGGATWSRAPDPFLGGVFADGWTLAEDDVGRIYAADTQGQVVGVASSANKGLTWDIQSDIVAVGTIVDRPWIAARGDGEVSLVVNSDRGGECYRSTDRGATFLSRSLVNNGGTIAGNLQYDTRGRLWWSTGDALWRWSTPCGSAPARIDHVNSGPQIMTQVDTDSQDRVYFAQPPSNSATMLLYGFVPGTPMKSLAVSPATLKSNTFGAIAVDNATGEIAVGWYGSTTAGNPSSSSFSGSWHVFVARVSNFWSATPTITVTQVTPASTPNHVGGFCMSGIACTTGTADRDLLDYFGVTFAPDHSIHVAHGHDGAGSNADVRYAHVT